MPKSPQIDALARALHLGECRRQSDGPEPTYLAVEAAWEQTRNHWIYVARDALTFVEAAQEKETLE